MSETNVCFAKTGAYARTYKSSYKAVTSTCPKGSYKSNTFGEAKQTICNRFGSRFVRDLVAYKSEICNTFFPEGDVHVASPSGNEGECNRRDARTRNTSPSGKKVREGDVLRVRASLRGTVARSARTCNTGHRRG